MEPKYFTNGQPLQAVKPAKKSFSEKATFWVGIIGSAVTIVLTIWNAYTKKQIDEREAKLKALEYTIKDRSTHVEESKEKVDRYKWVLSLFPILNGKDENEKNFTINLIRLALTKEEAEQLFTRLQASSDTTLQSVGQSGVTAIQDEPIAILVSQMNASSATERKSAVQRLVNDYKSSSPAIALTLQMYDKNKITRLSPSGIINGLYYLAATDPAAWNKQQLNDGQNLIKTLESNNPGSQTREAINAFKSLLQKVKVNSI